MCVPTYLLVLVSVNAAVARYFLCNNLPYNFFYLPTTKTVADECTGLPDAAVIPDNAVLTVAGATLSDDDVTKLRSSKKSISTGQPLKYKCATGLIMVKTGTRVPFDHPEWTCKDWKWTGSNEPVECGRYAIVCR